jgi:hypothetical protein
MSCDNKNNRVKEEEITPRLLMFDVKNPRYEIEKPQDLITQTKRLHYEVHFTVILLTKLSQFDLGF